MNGIMGSIEPCHGSPFPFNKDLILNNEFSNLPFLQSNLASDTIFMSKIPKICLQKEPLAQNRGWGVRSTLFTVYLVPVR